MEISINDIKSKFDELPEELQFAIMGVGIDDKVIGIGQDEGLNVSQMGQLALEVWAVILGWTAPEKFEVSVRTSLGIPNEKAKFIVGLINERIIKKIREEEKRIGESNKQINDAKQATDTSPKEAGVVSAPVNVTEKPANPPSIAAQRLAGSFKIPMKTTDHTLVPTPKTETLSEKPTLKPDPYREIPE